MLKNCKALTEQTITLSSIGFAEVHISFCITLQISNTNRLLNSSGNIVKIQYISIIFMPVL